jgi:hypothetical protein
MYIVKAAMGLGGPKNIWPNICLTLGIFYIFSISILQKYMIRPKFCRTIHLPPWPTASGVLSPRGTTAGAVAHWQGHIPPWATALGP